MGDIFRSEKMVLCQMYLPEDSAYHCIAQLGEIGLVQFRDLNKEFSIFQRKFVTEMRRCDEFERMMRFFEQEINLEGIEIDKLLEYPEAATPSDLIPFEERFTPLYFQLNSMNISDETIKEKYLHLNELKYVLQNVSHFFHQHENINAFHELEASNRYSNATLEVDLTNSLSGESLHNSEQLAMEERQINFIAGVINRKRLLAFERLLWRVCRGNVFLRQENIVEPLEDPHTRTKVEKTVFIVFFQGDQLRNRIERICDAFKAKIYSCPVNAHSRRERSIEVVTQLEDMITILNHSKDQRMELLHRISIDLKCWFVVIGKMKSVFHILNLLSLDVTQRALIGECWCPENQLDTITTALHKGTIRSGSTVPSILNQIETKDIPPTYFQTNKFTNGFQNIVNAYGFANYREINPTPWTCVTFPFLFAVMFGDVGHGFILFITALFIVIMEKKLATLATPGSIFSIFYGGRYVILMMGIFSIYTGLIYNECFSKSFAIFGSSGWKNPYSFNDLLEHYDVKSKRMPKFTVNPKYGFHDGIVYPIGFDPIWKLANNRLNFQNSFKMKMSIILGILQMTFGVVLSLLNHMHFKDTLSIICEFVPQMIFLANLFIYLCGLIFFKWLIFGVYPKNTSIGYYPGSNCAPSLLVDYINMFLKTEQIRGFVQNETNPTKPFPNCNLSQFYPHQFTIEKILVGIAILCVPWMLLIKPFVLRHRQTKRKRSIVSLNSETEETMDQASTSSQTQEHGHDETVEFSFGDAFVIQSIHTIEFALGCISHTASYLRLWALSLAHAELSEVLWSFVMGCAFREGGKMKFYGGIVLYVFFLIFAILTVAVLIFLEGLSAFLHTLRLHWVEFQSKFYSGGGHAFVPFSFESKDEAEN